MINIRNFCIIAHIDHGKSTLADRFLELTKVVEKAEKQMLDTMELEQERGITIKLQPVRMEWKDYLLNLIDTPGHVDFSYEVSRSLAAVEGAILLVDASQGIQAQTLSNLHLAQNHNLTIIPVINKIDLSSARPEETKKELEALGVEFACEPILVSAKTGENVEKVLEAVVNFIPPPLGDSGAPLRALVFDSFYDPYRGVVAYVRVVDGEISAGERILMKQTSAESEALEVGKICLGLKKEEVLTAGQIGYIVTSLKDIVSVRVGDTITTGNSKQVTGNIEPLSGYREPQAMVFASLYPASSEDEENLRESLQKLKLNDASLSFTPETSKAFGRGFKCGFLGLLHLEIVKERLEREYDLSLVVTTPTVDYRMTPDGWREPGVRLEIITPSEYLGKILSLTSGKRGQVLSTETLGERIVVVAEAPLAEVIVDFYDRLKSLTSGYGSLSYELVGYRSADLEELNIFIAGEKIEALTQLVPKIKIEKVARGLVEKLKGLLPRQNFEVKIQAAVGSRILASERISSLRKDVTAKLYGGDVTRKKKLWEKQKKGKKKMARLGRVEVPTEVFIKLLR